MNLEDLKNIAVEAALSAGRVIKEYMNDDVLVEHKEGGASYATQVVTVVDRLCESAILSHLLPTCDKYDIALLSEETEDDGSRFDKDYFWCIDPMDGTLAFINKQPGFSVSIALVANDGLPYIGVVYNPSTEVMYYAIKGKGAYRNGKPWEIKNTNNHLTYVTDRDLKDAPQVDKLVSLLKDVKEDLNLKGIKEIAGAGAVLNAILVLENGPACMIKLPKIETGGGSVWDYVATACIYHELGLPATNFDGGQLDLNRKDGTFMNHEGVLFSNLILDK